MDYDETEIATTYDKARALAPETLLLWQDLLSAHSDRAAISLVIDLGCGTGRFSEVLAAHSRVHVIGIDPSEKMVDQARRKPAHWTLYRLDQLLASPPILRLVANCHSRRNLAAGSGFGEGLLATHSRARDTEHYPTEA